MKFYSRAWAKYPEAVPGTLKLIPPKGITTPEADLSELLSGKEAR